MAKFKKEGYDNVYSHDNFNGGSEPPSKDMETRMRAVETALTKLETRFDAELKHLSTKKDISDLENRAKGWLVGILATIVIGFIATIGSNYIKISGNNDELQKSILKLNESIQQINKQ